MGEGESEESATCRICGKPILKGEPRYREPDGDVHVQCHAQRERQDRER